MNLDHYFDNMSLNTILRQHNSLYLMREAASTRQEKINALRNQIKLLNYMNKGGKMKLHLPTDFISHFLDDKDIDKIWAATTITHGASNKASILGDMKNTFKIFSYLDFVKKGKGTDPQPPDDGDVSVGSPPPPSGEYMDVSRRNINNSNRNQPNNNNNYTPAPSLANDDTNPDRIVTRNRNNNNNDNAMRSPEPLDVDVNTNNNNNNNDDYKDPDADEDDDASLELQQIAKNTGVTPGRNLKNFQSLHEDYDEERFERERIKNVNEDERRYMEMDVPVEEHGISNSRRNVRSAAAEHVRNVRKRGHLANIPENKPKEYIEIYMPGVQVMPLSFDQPTYNINTMTDRYNEADNIANT